MDTASQPLSSSDTIPSQRRTTAFWPASLVVVGIWGSLVPFIGPSLGIQLDVQLSVKIVDHLIPGMVAVAVGVAALLRRRSGHPSDDTTALVLALAASLAGFFMTMTHLPLVRDDLRAGIFPSARMLLHTPPGVVLLALAGARTARLFATE